MFLENCFYEYFISFLQVPLDKLYERDGAMQRKSCSDPIPTCSQPCQRTLKCGVPGSFHECQALCHEGPCPPCPLETPVKCRCGSMDQNVLCSELTTKADEVTCKRSCKKVCACVFFFSFFFFFVFNISLGNFFFFLWFVLLYACLFVYIFGIMFRCLCTLSI